MFEPLAGYDPATYGLRNRIRQGNPSEFSRSFGEQMTSNEAPHASSRIFAREADRVALSLLDAQATWLGTHDVVKLRRMLLGLLACLDE